MIDLHSHVIPGIDDGPATMEGSVELARAAVAAGITAMAATPHIDFKHNVDPARLRADRDALAAALREAAVPLQVLQGGEIAMSRLTTLSDADLRAVTLGDGPWLLVECPFTPMAPLLDTLGPLSARGFRVLLAHPERCPAFISDPLSLRGHVSAGVLTQLTAASFTGAFGSSVRDAALRMLEAGLAHVISSDTHDAHHRRPSLEGGLEAACDAIEGADALVPWLTVDVPGAIVSGREPPRRPEVELRPASRRSGLFRRGRRRN